MNEAKKFFIFSTAAGCTSNLWESAVYDDYLQSSGMKRVYKQSDADVIIVNTCAVTPDFEDQSEDYIKKTVSKNLNVEEEDKKVIVAGCYSAIRSEKIDNDYSNVTHIRPVEMEKLSSAVELEHKKGFTPIETSHFDDINNCSSTFAHKIVWYFRKFIRKTYELLEIKDSYLLNFLDTMIFSENFYVVDVGHGCAGGCTFCSIKQSRGFISSNQENSVVENIEVGYSKGHRNFWLLATDIGAWGLDRNQNPADLLAPIYQKDLDIRLVLNYIEPRWLLYHENIHQFLKDRKSIGVSIPIQSGSTRLIKHSGRRYDPQDVSHCTTKIKKSNPNLIVKTNLMVGLPTESWKDFYYSLKAVFDFDVIVPVIYGIRPGTKAEKDPNQIPTWIKFLRMGIICAASLAWQAYLCAKSFFKDLAGLSNEHISTQYKANKNI